MSAIRVRVSLGADPETGIMAMVAYSAAAHVIATLVIFFGPKFLPEKHQAPRILAGEIVSLPPAAPPPPAGGASAPAPAPTTPTPSERAEAAASALKERKQTPAPPPPEEKPAPKKKEPPKPPPKEPKTKAPVTAVGEEKKGETQGTAKPQPPSSAPKGPPGKLPEGIGFAGAEGGTPGGIPSINSSAFPYDWYRTTIVNLIRSRWRRPVTPGLNTSLRCSISFVISRNGTISDAALMEASGFSALDDSALRAVIESSPLPQLPYQYTTDSVGAALVFELTPD